MNKIREEIKKLLPRQKETKIDEIMEVILIYLELAFDAAKDQRHLGCGDYEDMYWSWNTWYDEEVNI